MSEYQDQLKASNIDLDFWRNPEGVSVPDDELRFLFVPDRVEYEMLFDVAQQVHQFQIQNSGSRQQINKALMVTMGGLLPGVYLYDHLVEGKPEQTPALDFGTIGVTLYEGPGQRLETPIIDHDVSVPVKDEVVLIIDDLGDYGGTMRFLVDHVTGLGAKKIFTLVLYMKPAAWAACAADFYFGEIPQDTWIITPRERVETLIKRVPVWKERGASKTECRNRLVEMIGYPENIVDYYLPLAYDTTS